MRGAREQFPSLSSPLSADPGLDFGGRILLLNRPESLIDIPLEVSSIGILRSELVAKDRIVEE